MTGAAHFLSSWILLSLLSHCALDDEAEAASCDFKASCVLPCSFQPGPNVVVNWDRPGVAYISRYNNGEDRGTRHEEYRGRTSLFVQEISRGNASLLLKDVRVQDEGLYWCLASTGDGLRKTPIRVRVRAPVVDVSLELRRGELVCRSEGIYPEPAVTWTFSTGPAPDPQTSVNPSETGLFSVVSSVPLTLSAPLKSHCFVSTESSRKRATYRRKADIRLSDSLTVPCAETTAPVKSLVWKFNHEKIIYNKTRTDVLYSDFWFRFVDGLTAYNGLVLKNLTLDHLGLFSCEVSSEYETFITATEVTDRSPELWTILGGVLGGVLLLILLIILFFLCQQRLKCVCTRRKRSNTEEQNGREEEAAIELNSLDQRRSIVVEESPLQSEDFRTDFDHSDESFYESQSTDTPRGSVRCEESSGFGQSGVDSNSNN